MGAMKDRMLRGELYLADDPDLAADLARAQDLVARYNATAHAQEAERDELLRQLLGAVGDGVVVRPPFRCEYGSPVSIGTGTFLNFDCLTRDLPAGVVAVGSPARPVREIRDGDRVAIPEP